MLTYLLVTIAALPFAIRANWMEWSLLASYLGVGLISSAPLVSQWLSVRGFKCFALVSLGLLIPLAPLLGPHSVFLLIAAFPIAARIRICRQDIQWAAPILVFIGAQCLTEVSTTIAWSLDGDGVLRGVVPIDLLDRLKSLLTVHSPSFAYFARILAFVIAVGSFEKVRCESSHFRRGLCIGIAIAVGAIIAQYADLLPFNPPAQNSFWSALGRLSGTFSDPNAAGVFLGLVIFAIYGVDRRAGTSRLWLLALGCALFLAAVLAGSRTFYLEGGVALLIITATLSLRRFILILLVLGACLVGWTVLDLQTDLVGQLISSAWLPNGAKRILATASLVRLSETFFSRAVFLALSFKLLPLYPIFGVGGDNFRYFVPALAEAAGINLGGWIDNSNNFYIGLLSEIGIVGSSIAILSACNRRFREGASAERIGLMVLLVVLVTGPHIEFGEVMALAAFFTAMATQSRAVSLTHLSRPVGLTLLLAIGLMAPFTREWGGYAWERTGSAYHQWTTGVTYLFVTCPCEGAARLSVEAPFVPKDGSMSVRAFVGRRMVSEISFSSADTKILEVPCVEKDARVAKWYPMRRRIKLLISPSWIPARLHPEKSADRRVLGVRLRHRRTRDLLGGSACTARSDSDASQLARKP